eukprot:GHVN01008365.1.p1 GENE.GHVN01008365.1~~GHVN01008365.1.p1  ORF type:complete len:408 (+),score=57.64 GHVN01008365.1:71-1294(+)
MRVVRSFMSVSPLINSLLRCALCLSYLFYLVNGVSLKGRNTHQHGLAYDPNDPFGGNTKLVTPSPTSTTTTRPPKDSLGEYSMLTFEGNGAALVDSSSGYVTRHAIENKKNLDELLPFKVKFEQFGDKHKIILSKQDKKFALETNQQSDGRFKMALVENDDLAKEGYVDLFYLKVNTKRKKCGIHPFFITASWTGKDDKPFEVIVRNNGAGSGFEGELRPEPEENHEFYLFTVVTKNTDFNNDDMYMFENQKEHKWLGVDAGQGGKNWPGVVALKDMGRKDVCMRVFWETNGAPKNFWSLQATDSGVSGLVLEGKEYVPVRHNAWRLMVGGGRSVAWALDKCTSNHYCRIRKNHDKTGWTVMYRIAPWGGGVSAICTSGTGANNNDIWKTIRFMGKVKELLKITSEI